METPSKCKHLKVWINATQQEWREEEEKLTFFEIEYLFSKPNCRSAIF